MHYVCQINRPPTRALGSNHCNAFPKPTLLGRGGEGGG